MAWLIGIGLWGLFLLFAWVLVLNFRRADEQAARIHADEDQEVQ